MTGSVSMTPRKIALGSARITGNRVITLWPVIRCGAVHEWNGLTHYEPDTLWAYRIAVSGSPPRSALKDPTTLSFETTSVPDHEEPYDVRWFFESVEWKDVSAGYKFTGCPLWDEFVAERWSGAWPKPIEFLGIARYAEGPSRDPEVRELLGNLTDDRHLACWYRIPKEVAA